MLPKFKVTVMTVRLEGQTFNGPNSKSDPTDLEGFTEVEVPSKKGTDEDL